MQNGEMVVGSVVLGGKVAPELRSPPRRPVTVHPTYEELQAENEYLKRRLRELGDELREVLE